jgi:succinoglycan biosynthesis protein ExoA
VLKNITVIIPVYNEEKFLPEIFESLKSQDYPKESTEVIFVDGNSDDNSIKLLEAFKIEYPNLKVLINPEKIVPISMNLGIREAKGEFVIRWDAHSKYGNDYFSKCVEYLEKTGAENVGGPIRLIGDFPVQKAIRLATTCPFGIGNSGFHYENFEGYVDTVYLGAYRKNVFDKIGLYDEELVRNQDDELNYRLIKSGGKIYMTPEIISFYYPRPSLKKLWIQYYQYGYWKVRVIQKHKAPASIRHLVPGTFVLSIFLGLILSFYKGLGLIILIPVLGLYVPALLFFTIRVGNSHDCSLQSGEPVSINNTYKNLILLAMVFCILHFSYGTGFLKGIYDFYIIKRKKTILPKTE